MNNFLWHFVVSFADDAKSGFWVNATVDLACTHNFDNKILRIHFSYFNVVRPVFYLSYFGG